MTVTLTSACIQDIMVLDNQDIIGMSVSPNMKTYNIKLTTQIRYTSTMSCHMSNYLTNHWHWSLNRHHWHVTIIFSCSFLKKLFSLNQHRSLGPLCKYLGFQSSLSHATCSPVMSFVSTVSPQQLHTASVVPPSTPALSEDDGFEGKGDKGVKSEGMESIGGYRQKTIVKRPARAAHMTYGHGGC